MTRSRARTATLRPTRPRRRNRKKSAPPWRRLPELRQALGALLRHARRAVPALIAAAAASLVFACGFLGYRFLTMSSRFAVQVFEVRGNQHVPDLEVLAAMGVEPGDNIFRLDAGALARVLEEQPWISRAVVRRELPDTLLVDIEENQPAALVELDGLYLASARGRVFKRAQIERGDGADLPVITGLDRATYAEAPELVEADIRDALAAIDLYHQTHGRPALGEIHLHPRHGITFVTYDHAVAVRMGRGDPQRLRQRLSAFDLAWRALSDGERRQARIVYADASTRTDRVTVGFARIE